MNYTKTDSMQSIFQFGTSFPLRGLDFVPKNMFDFLS